MTKILDVASQPQLAEILRSIEQGDKVILTRDGRVIAEVKPVETSPKKEFLDLALARDITWRTISMPSCRNRFGGEKNEISY